MGATQNRVAGVERSVRLRSRREFLRVAGAAGIGAAVVPILATACVPLGGEVGPEGVGEG